MGGQEQSSIPETPGRAPDEVLAARDHAERARISQGRLLALLDAIQAVVEESDLESVLRRIAEAARVLADARYGALGVIAPEKDALEEFIHVGLSEADASKIGHLPTGRGLLGVLIADPHPIRLPHMWGDPRAVGFPPYHPHMESFLGVPVRVRGEVFGNLYLTDHRGGGFTDEDERLVEALAATAGFAIENARLLEQARTRERWMIAAAELSADLLSSPTDTAYDLIASRLVELPDIDKATVLLADDLTTRLQVAAIRGLDEAEWSGAMVESDATCGGDVVSSGRASAHQRETAVDRDPVRVVQDGAAGPVIAAPLRTHARLWGVVCVAREPDRRRFTATEFDSIVDFASRATIALELAYAREAGERALLAEDRRRIARDLHDHVIQQLFGAGLTLHAVAGTMPTGPEAERVRESIDQLDDAVSQIRTVVFALSHRDEGSLRHRVIDVVADLSATLRHPPAIRFTGPVDHAVTGAPVDDIVGVTRELLSNAVRHSKADRISVEVAIVDESVIVIVEDDGVGIAEGAKRSGLKNLADKAAERGGALTVQSRVGATSVRWSAPLTAGADDRSRKR
jgi:signal transduction histidine kinase